MSLPHRVTSIVAALVVVTAMMAPFTTMAPVSTAAAATSTSSPDLTTWQEYDPQNTIQNIGTDNYDIVDADANEAFRLHSSQDKYTIGLNDDGKIKFNINVTAGTSAGSLVIGYAGENKSIRSTDRAAVEFLHNGNVVLLNSSDGSNPGTINLDTTYYVTFKVDRDNSSATVEVYSDSSRSTLAFSGTIDIKTAVNYSYVYIASGGDRSSSGSLDAKVNNVTLGSSNAEYVGQGDVLDSYTVENPNGNITVKNSSVYLMHPEEQYENAVYNESSGFANFSYSIYVDEGNGGTAYVGYGDEPVGHHEMDYFAGVVLDSGTGGDGTSDIAADIVNSSSSSKGSEITIQNDETYYIEGEFANGNVTVQVYQSESKSTLVGTSTHDIADSGDYNYRFAYTSPNGTKSEYVYARLTNYNLPSGGGVDVSGRVVNQRGNPVSNATVEIFAVDKSKISAPGAQTKLERAKELLQQAKNATPSSWDPNQKLLGGTGLFTNAKNPYVATHTPADWGLAAYSDAADLTSPRLQSPAGQDIILSVWTPSAEDWPENAINKQLPGKVNSDTKIVIESLSHTGEVVNKRVVATDSVFSNKILGVSTVSAEYARVSLPPGFYRIYPRGHPENAYTRVVGEPAQLANSIEAKLRDKAQTLTKQAKNIQDRISNGTFVRKRVVTNSTGEFSTTVPANVKVVSVQAYKKPAGLDSVTSGNLTLADIRTYYRTTDYSGAVVLPAGAKTTELPATNVSVHVVEARAPTYGNLTKYANITDLVEGLLNRTNYEDLNTFLQQRFENASLERLRNLARENRELINQNPVMERQLTNITGGQYGKIEDLSRSELKALTNAQQEVIQNYVTDLDVDTEDTGSKWLGKAVTFPSRLTKAEVSVTAHWTNGTSVPVPDKFVSLDYGVGASAASRSATTTTIRVESAFANNSKASGLSLEYRVVTEDGIGSETTFSDNPFKKGQPPGLRSVSFSTLYPGPDEKVYFTLNPGAQTTITGLNSVTVFAPDGSKATHNISGPRSAWFQTEGTGVYTIQSEFRTSDGNSTFTYRIRAGERRQAMPPGIRISDTPYGTVAVVGDGLAGGNVDVEAGGSSVSVVGQLPANSKDTPSVVHVYTTDTTLPSDAVLSVGLVRGSDQQAVSKHVRVVAHIREFQTDTYTLYRNSKPLPRDGENANGAVYPSPNGTVIKTYTTDTGTVTITTHADPWFGERAQYQVELLLTGVDAPVIALVPGGGPAAAPLGMLDLVTDFVTVLEVAEAAIDLSAPAMGTPGPAAAATEGVTA